VHNITDHDGDGSYGQVTLIFGVNPSPPPPTNFLRIKFGKKSGGNTQANTVTDIGI
jgi:hypothetical protein